MKTSARIFDIFSGSSSVTLWGGWVATWPVRVMWQEWSVDRGELESLSLLRVGWWRWMKKASFTFLLYQSSSLSNIFTSSREQVWFFASRYSLMADLDPFLDVCSANQPSTETKDSSSPRSTLCSCHMTRTGHVTTQPLAAPLMKTPWRRWKFRLMFSSRSPEGKFN